MHELAKSSQSNYVAILGDQIRSRLVAERPAELIDIRKWYQEVNVRCASWLTVPFSLSQGDEIQALASSPVDAWEVVEALDTSSRLSTFRYALGIGSITTPLAERTWEMDGPAFHRARDVMAEAKRQDRWLSVRGLGEQHDAILDGVARALQVIREGWTSRQRQALAVRRQEKLQKDAARRLGLDPSTMSKMLKAAHYHEYMEIEQAFRELLQRFWREWGSGAADDD
jgi:hypothetical protein